MTRYAPEDHAQKRLPADALVPRLRDLE